MPTSDTHPRIQEDIAARQRFLKTPDDTTPLARLIDSTLLKPDMTTSALEKLVQDACRYHFRSVCVPPTFVAQTRKFLDAAKASGTNDVAICTVVGFPNGTSTIATKVFEMQDALDAGADEIDFVQNASLIKEGNLKTAAADFKALVQASRGALLKIILETSLLTDEEIAKAAAAALDAGVHVIKTSTGFGSRGASERDMEIIRGCLDAHHKGNPARFGIKASGGIRTYDNARRYVEAGATRIGTSNGERIVQRAVPSDVSAFTSSTY